MADPTVAACMCVFLCTYYTTNPFLSKFKWFAIAIHFLNDNLWKLFQQ